MVGIAYGLKGTADLQRPDTPAESLAGSRSAFFTVAGLTGISAAIVFGLSFDPVTGVAAAVAIALVSAVATEPQWLVFAVARAWFAVSGQLPFRLMHFLEDAYTRGVLRRVGGIYQFRHADLQDHLAER
jgi:hypothetical protein